MSIDDLLAGAIVVGSGVGILAAGNLVKELGLELYEHFWCYQQLKKDLKKGSINKLPSIWNAIKVFDDLYGIGRFEENYDPFL